MGSKLLLVSAICAITIPSVSYAEEVMSPKNFEDYSNLFEGRNKDVLKRSLYPNTYNNPFSHQIKSTLKETNTNIKKIDNIEEGNPVISTAFPFVCSMHTEDYKSAFDLTSRSLQKIVSEKWLKNYWEELPTQLQKGSFIEIGEVTQKETNSVHTNVEINLVFEQITVPLLIKLDPSGKIDDFQLSMPFSPVTDRPSYSNPKSFVDKEVVVGSGAFPLPGTLSVPKGKGPFPAVILVHGAGAADQDSATYALKPFRDLAEGLASKGIAVLRYNKRTYERQPEEPIYKEWISASGWFRTLVEEQITRLDAIAEKVTEADRNRMKQHFIISSQNEYSFWEMAYTLEKWPVNTDVKEVIG
ncbi:hypothetical protein COM12_11480 [Bacillus wiedmannii]|nr:hypothetical protein [Bacillus wiedmannii]PGB67447.1 hypothetical protein COM12_11480 [Bacillus wiedmannii]